jgi:hypothetical protein
MDIYSIIGPTCGDRNWLEIARGCRDQHMKHPTSAWRWGTRQAVAFGHDSRVRLQYHCTVAECAFEFMMSFISAMWHGQVPMTISLLYALITLFEVLVSPDFVDSLMRLRKTEAVDLSMADNTGRFTLRASCFLPISSSSSSSRWLVRGVAIVNPDWQPSLPLHLLLWSMWSTLALRTSGRGGEDGSDSRVNAEGATDSDEYLRIV